MSFVITPPATPAVPVAGAAAGAQFPVHRIYCVGRNYVEHAKEMGFSGREPPFFFMKPADAVLAVAEGQTGQMPYPTLTKDLHHEVELVVAIGTGGRNIAAGDAMKHVWGYAVGLDMTRRNQQSRMKSKQWPWEVGKSFEDSAPCGTIYPASAVGHLSKGRIQLAVNGKTQQDSDLDKMIWNVPEIIHHLSAQAELKAGDLIFTGTPEGVAAVVAGDTLVGEVAGLPKLSVKIA